MSTPFKFFMHRTERDAIVDSSDSDEVNEDNPLSYWSVSAHRKIDVNKLKSLVKTITLKEFAEQCSTGLFSIDSVFELNLKTRYRRLLPRPAKVNPRESPAGSITSAGRCHRHSNLSRSETAQRGREPVTGASFL